MTCRRYNPFSWDPEFIVVWAWWSSGGRLHFFFWYIYYLTVSKDEYCALSALCRRYIETYCRGELLHLLLVGPCKKWSLSRLVSVRLHHLYVMLTDKILMLCPLWHSLILHHGFTFHITPMGDVTTVRICDTSRPCHHPVCPCTVLSLTLSLSTFDWYSQWQYRSFRIIDRFWSHRFGGPVYAAEAIELWNWASELPQEALIGSWVWLDGWWRSNRKAYFHRIMKDMLRHTTQGACLEFTSLSFLKC